MVLVSRRSTSPKKELNTTMLIALNATATRVAAEDATRSDRYRCPACHDDVTLKQGAHVIWHFAHRAGSSCRHGDGESLRHLEMKAKVRKRLVSRELTVDYEVRIEHGKRHRITDLLINDPAVGAYVIECQVSPMDGREYAARMRFYNEAGLPCLVLWDHALAMRRNVSGALAERYVSTIETGVEYKMHGGIVSATEDLGIRVHYTLAEPQEVDDPGLLRAIHLRPGNVRPARWRTTYDGEQWIDSYVPKFLREVQHTTQVPWNVSIERTPSDLQVVRLGEAPIHTWTAAQGRDLVIESPTLRRSLAKVEPVMLPLFDTRPWESRETGWD